MKLEGKVLYKKGIYIITCLANGDRYIGSSRNLMTRFANHRHVLRNKSGHNRHFQSIWDKYGEESFVVSVIEYIMFDFLLIEHEQFWIDLLRPEINKTIKANSGFLGRQHSKETKMRLSEIQKARMTPERRENLRQKAIEQNKRQTNGMKGKTLSDEEKENRRQCTLQQFSTEESRKEHGRITKLAMGKSRASEKIRASKLGLKATDETKRKMSIAQKKRRAKEREGAII